MCKAGVLEKISKGVSDVRFRKQDVQQMYVLLERLTWRSSEKLEPTTRMGMTTLSEPEYWEVLGRELERGDSIIFIPYGREIKPYGVAHELAHVVWNSFCQEWGVNYRFVNHFKLCQISVCNLLKYPDEFHEWLGKRYGSEKIREELFCYAVADFLYRRK